MGRLGRLVRLSRSWTPGRRHPPKRRELRWRRRPSSRQESRPYHFPCRGPVAFPLQRLGRWRPCSTRRRRPRRSCRRWCGVAPRAASLHQRILSVRCLVVLLRGLLVLYELLYSVVYESWRCLFGGGETRRGRVCLPSSFHYRTRVRPCTCTVSSVAITARALVAR